MARFTLRRLLMDSINYTALHEICDETNGLQWNGQCVLQ
jgi:hypothetical protein